LGAISDRYGTIMELGPMQGGEFVLITAASSSAGLAAIEMIRGEGGQSIATTVERLIESPIPRPPGP